MINILTSIKYVMPGVVAGLVLAISSIAVASDHADGELSIANAVADITDLYAFPGPENPQRLVVILNSYPFVSSRGHFSDRLIYSLVLRPLTIEGTGPNSHFNIIAKEYRFDCKFETPHDDSAHSMNCTTPSGAIVKTVVGNEVGAEAMGVRAFAGRRSDPFLFSQDWFEDVVFNRCIPPANASNILDGLNVLSIILELDINQIFAAEHRSLLAVAGEISERENNKVNRRIIDRVGRPEISNGHLVTQVNHEDLRTIYNQEHTFSINSENKERYRERIQENIHYYDNIDKTRDWEPPMENALVNLLVNDFLVIDVSKPFSPQGYFDVEQSMLRSQVNTRSGGRVPGERVINSLMTTNINGGRGQAITDGIEAETLPSQQFPYLGKPHSGFRSFFKQLLAPKLVAPLSMKKRAEDSSCKK